jgi:hypothetical protein
VCCAHLTVAGHVLEEPQVSRTLHQQHLFCHCDK